MCIADSKVAQKSESLKPAPVNPETQKLNMYNLPTNESAVPALRELAQRIATFPLHCLNHPAMEQMPEWQGADLRIRSSPPHTDPADDFGAFSRAPLFTRHSRALTWLLFELRDALSEHVDFINKYAFYAGLESAARRHLETNQPEPADPRPLLLAVFAQALHWREVAGVNCIYRECETPDDASAFAGQNGDRDSNLGRN